MKSYEILSAGSIAGGAVSKSGMKSTGCGCTGADCGSKGGGCGPAGGDMGGVTPGRQFLGRNLKEWEMTPSNSGLSPWHGETKFVPPIQFPEPIGAGPGSTGTGPGTDPCYGLSQDVQNLRQRIRDALSRFGRWGGDIARARGASEQVCDATDPASLCVALGNAFTSSPLEGAGVAARNAIWHVWTACVSAQQSGIGSSSFVGWRNIACIAARNYAVQLEHHARNEVGDYDIWYERDIAPLVRRLRVLEVDLLQCGTGTVVPLVSCRNTGSNAACTRNRKRCTYGMCDDGRAGCDHYIYCGPGNWMPPCPAYHNCGRY